MNELKIKDLTTMDFMGLFSPDGKCIKVSTRDIANKFGKRNNDLVSAIENRINTIKSIGENQYDDFTLNFEESKLTEHKESGE